MNRVYSNTDVLIRDTVKVSPQSIEQPDEIIDSFSIFADGEAEYCLQLPGLAKVFNSIAVLNSVIFHPLYLASVISPNQSFEITEMAARLARLKTGSFTDNVKTVTR